MAVSFLGLTGILYFEKFYALCGRVVWVLGMFGVEGVSRCVWQGVTFFGVALFGVGGGVVGGADGVRGCMSMNILFGSFCYWGHTFLVALFCANFLWIYCLEGFAVGGSHFLMSHYIEFMSFIELANLLNSWTYGPINNNNNKTRVSC